MRPVFDAFWVWRTIRLMRQQLLKILVPSWQQLAAYVLLSLVTVIIPNLQDASAIKESSQEVWPILQQSIRNFINFLDAQTVIPHLPEIVSWGLIGLGVYLLLLLLENVAISILNLAIFENSYIHKLPWIQRLKNGAKLTERMLFRVSLIVFLALWSLFTVFLLVPFAISTFGLFLNIWQEPAGWQNVVAAVAALVLAQHIGVVFFRMLFLRADYHHAPVQ